MEIVGREILFRLRCLISYPTLAEKDFSPYGVSNMESRIPLSTEDMQPATDFQNWLTATFQGDANFEGVQKGEAEAETRVLLGERKWIEVTLTPEKELRVGFVTRDRYENEGTEQRLLDMRENISEMIEIEVEELGGSGVYHVDHYYDRDARVFRWVCKLPLSSVSNLESEEFRAKVRTLVRAWQRVMSELLS